LFGLERVSDRNIWRVYGVTLLVGLAYGVSLSLTALYLDAHGFGKETIGTLAAWFALGLVLASLPIGALLRRFSARRVLVLALLGYAGSVTAFPWPTSYAALAAVRFVDGACSVAVWVSCETLLLSLSGREHKAFTTSLYTIALAIGYVLGPVLARLIVAFAPVTLAFAVAGVLALVAALYAGLSIDPKAGVEVSDASSEAAPVSVIAVLWKIKNSCFAAFSYGYFEASVVLFLPLFLIEKKSISHDQTILIPAFFAAGMLLFSNWAARVGDRLGHLFVMRCLAVIGTTMILGFVFLNSYTLMCAAVFIAGATLAPISPVSLALQGVQCEPREYGRAASVYNTFYAAGILLGPLFASRIFARIGGEFMLFHLAALWSAFIVFSMIFARDDPRVRASLAPAAP
jgi:MFS family permease